jgi:hypothetical protein
MITLLIDFLIAVTIETGKQLYQESKERRKNRESNS